MKFCMCVDGLQYYLIHRNNREEFHSMAEEISTFYQDFVGSSVVAQLLTGKEEG